MRTTFCRKVMARPAVVLASILLAATLAGCGGSVATGNGTTYVTVTVGGGASAAVPATASSRPAPRPLAATIPPTVTAIRFTIGGPGIDNIVQTFPVTGTTMTVTLQVPTGPARTILVEALDSDGIPRYRGGDVFDAFGVPLSLTIVMVIDPSNPALQTWAVVDNTLSLSASLNRFAQGGGIVLAGGSQGEIHSSTDGVSWTSRNSRNISGDISALTFGGGAFLAMTSAGNFTAFPVSWTNRFYSAPSDNVDAWAASGVIVTVGNPVADIAFGNGIFAAVGDNSAFFSADNGATWSAGAVSGVSYLTAVSYGNGRFVATDAASDNVVVSTDGILWTPATLGLTSPEVLERIGFGGGLFLLTTSSGDVYTSPDGASWLRRSRFADIAGSDTSVLRVSYAAGAFLIVTGSPVQIFFSTDSGDTWIPLDPFGAGSSYYLEDVSYWNGAFVGAGGDYLYPAFGLVFRSGNL